MRYAGGDRLMAQVLAAVPILKYISNCYFWIDFYLIKRAQ
jgi:hypothetical protein